VTYSFVFKIENFDELGEEHRLEVHTMPTFRDTDHGLGEAVKRLVKFVARLTGIDAKDVPTDSKRQIVIQSAWRNGKTRVRVKKEEVYTAIRKLGASERPTPPLTKPDSRGSTSPLGRRVDRRHR
jgi:hypothetical protein